MGAETPTAAPTVGIRLTLTLADARLMLTALRARADAMGAIVRQGERDGWPASQIDRWRGEEAEAWRAVALLADAARSEGWRL